MNRNREIKLQLFGSGEEAKTGIGKLKRKHLLHYINANFGSGDPVWFLIGKDVEEMNVELNPDTETKKNIWEEMKIRVKIHDRKRVKRTSRSE